MKSVLVFGLLVFGLSSFASEKINVTVTGMVCSFCSQGITKKFQEVKSVKSINVDLDKHLVALELNADQKIEDNKIKEILKDAGYGVEKIER